MDLHDFAASSRSGRQPIHSFDIFNGQPAVRALHWPDDVVAQWLHEHAGNENFERDYGHINLSMLQWTIEVIPLSTWLEMPTGASDGNCIEDYAANPDHWVGLRTSGVHAGVPQMWREHGTWKRRPLLIDRSLVTSRKAGLQLIEGRTRVGILRGFHRQQRYVAPSHEAWVARPIAPPKS